MSLSVKFIRRINAYTSNDVKGSFLRSYDEVTLFSFFFLNEIFQLKSYRINEFIFAFPQIDDPMLSVDTNPDPHHLF